MNLPPASDHDQDRNPLHYKALRDAYFVPPLAKNVLTSEKSSTKDLRQEHRTRSPTSVISGMKMMTMTDTIDSERRACYSSKRSKSASHLKSAPSIPSLISSTQQRSKSFDHVRSKKKPEFGYVGFLGKNYHGDRKIPAPSSSMETKKKKKGRSHYQVVHENSTLPAAVVNEKPWVGFVDMDRIDPEQHTVLLRDPELNSSFCLDTIDDCDEPTYNDGDTQSMNWDTHYLRSQEDGSMPLHIRRHVQDQLEQRKSLLEDSDLNSSFCLDYVEGLMDEKNVDSRPGFTKTKSFYWYNQQRRKAVLEVLPPLNGEQPDPRRQVSSAPTA